MPVRQVWICGLKLPCSHLSVARWTSHSPFDSQNRGYRSESKGARLCWCLVDALLSWSWLSRQDLMVGDEASQLRSMLEVNYPMENGIVRSWEDMLHVWDYTFYEKLKIDPKGCKVQCVPFWRRWFLPALAQLRLVGLSRQVLLTEPPMNPKKNREKMIEVSSPRVESGSVCRWHAAGQGEYYVQGNGFCIQLSAPAHQLRAYGSSLMDSALTTANKDQRHLWSWSSVVSAGEKLSTK